MAALTPQQCRAGRAWLNMRQEQLAELAKVGLSTLRDFEAGKRTPIPNNVDAIRRALEGAGIEFLNEETRRGIAGQDDTPAAAPRTAEA